MAIPIITSASTIASVGTGYTEDYRTNLLYEFNLDALNSDGFTCTNVTIENSLFYKGWGFDGTAYAVHADSADLRSSTGYYSGFIRRNAISGAIERIIDKTNASSDSYYFIFLPDNTLQFLCRWGDGLGFDFLTTTATISDTNWHYFEFFWNGADMGVSIDRGTDATKVAVKNLGSGTAPLTFGRWTPGPSQYFDGILDRVRFYSSVPNASQRDQIYNAQLWYLNNSIQSVTYVDSENVTYTGPVGGETLAVYSREGADSEIITTPSTSNIGTIKQFVGF